MYRRDAIRRGLSFSLSLEAFRALTSAQCHYCGNGPQSVLENSKGYNGAYAYNGIDRLDNDAGYTLENSVTCCKLCNRMKYTMSEEHFAAQCMKITRWGLGH